MLTLLAKLFHALNSESSPRQLALAIVLGLIAGLSPLFCLHNIVIFFLVLVIRVHLGSFILSLGAFSALSYLLSPIIVSVGESLLTAQGLSSLFASLYQFDLFKLAHWHHTYTFGALITGIGLGLPGYFVVHYLIVKYRIIFKTFVERFKIVKALKASNFYRIYLKVSGQGGLA